MAYIYDISKHDLEILCMECNSKREIAERLDVSESTVSRRMKEYGLVIQEKTFITDEYFIYVCNTSQSMKQASEKLNIPFTTFKRRAEKLGCYNTNQAGKGVKKEVNNPHYTYSMNSKYFDIWTPQMAYWLGYIVADGYIDKSRYIFKFVLQPEDIHVVEKLKYDLEYTGPIHTYPYTASNGTIVEDCPNLSISNKYFVKSLNARGFFLKNLRDLTIS